MLTVEYYHQKYSSNYCIFFFFINFFLLIYNFYAMDSTLYATIAIKTSSSGIMAMVVPFRNDCILGFFPASELKISFKARKTIKDITAITPRDITCVVVIVMVVVVTVDIIIHSLISRLYKLIGLIYSFKLVKLVILCN